MKIDVWVIKGIDVNTSASCGADITHSTAFVSMAMQTSDMIGRTVHPSPTTLLPLHTTFPTPLQTSTGREGSKSKTEALRLRKLATTEREREGGGGGGGGVASTLNGSLTGQTGFKCLLIETQPV